MSEHPVFFDVSGRRKRRFTFGVIAFVLLLVLSVAVFALSIGAVPAAPLLPVEAEHPVLHRLAYPEGDKHDAEALLLNGDGSPLIVTREIGKPAYVYQPTAPLKANNEVGVPMKRVAELTISATPTDGNPLARIGNQTISGGAVAPGGKKVALRTYTDALEWDVPNGDVVAAIKGKPRTTGLPDEITGEAIAYSADGKFFFTVSDMNGETGTPNPILRYTPATTVATSWQ